MKWFKIFFWTIGFIAIALSFSNWENNFHVDYYNDRYTENFYCVATPLYNCDYEMLDGFDKYLTGNVTEGFEIYKKDIIPTWRKQLSTGFFIFSFLCLGFLSSFKIIKEKWIKKDYK